MFVSAAKIISPRKVPVCVCMLLYTSVHLKLAPSMFSETDQSVYTEKRKFSFSVNWTCRVHQVFSKSETDADLTSNFNLIFLGMSFAFSSLNKNDDNWPFALTGQACFDWKELVKIQMRSIVLFIQQNFLVKRMHFQENISFL